MVKSKFIEILRSFSNEELKMFRDFVRSPFHNSNKNVIKLFDIARKYGPAYDSDALRKEKLFTKIYPSKKYNDTVMRILLSDLLRLGEEFIVQLGSKKSSAGNALVLLEELKNRGLDSLYRKNLKDVKALIDNMEDMRTRYFTKFEFEIINIDYNLRKDKQHLICEDVLHRAEYLIYFTLIELVRNVHDLIINERTYNAKFEFNLVFEFFKSFDFKKILEKVKINRPGDYPILNVHYSLLMALLHEEEEVYYDNFKTSLQSFMESLNDLEIYHFLHHLESCCLNRMKYNKEKYGKEIFNVYKLMLSTGCYAYGGSKDMTIQRFKNILIGAINLNELDWSEKFAEEYIGRISRENRDSIMAYSNAIISFGRKDFEKALAYLSKVKHDYFILKMDVKSWMLKIFYELKYYEQAISFIDSYKHFVSKNSSLSEHFKERHLNFLKFTSELFKLKSGTDKLKIQETERNLNNINNVVHREWLLEKIHEI